MAEYHEGEEYPIHISLSRTKLTEEDVKRILGGRTADFRICFSARTFAADVKTDADASLLVKAGGWWRHYTKPRGAC